MNINRQLTPYNHTPGRQGNRLQHVLLHTMVGTIGSAQSRFFNQNAGAAANYGVALNGEVRQWVSEGDTAWHAGNWPENLISIGVEFEDNGNYNDGVRTDALYNAGIDLIVDVARRNGLSGDFIRIHKQFSNTGCPDGLDVDRIKRGVAAILGGQAPANVPPRSDQPVERVTDTVTVTSATLMVRTEPRSRDDQGNKLNNHSVANTPDGNLHAGNVVQITGVVRAEDPYGDGRNLWGRSIHGRFFWLGGTNYYELHPEAVNPTPAPTPEAPAVQPENITDYTPFSSVATVTAGIGAHVRTGPGTNYPLNPTHTANAVLNQGETFEVSGYKIAQDPYGDGNALWVRSQYGNWVWAKNVNLTPAIPSGQPAPQVQAEAPAAPVQVPVQEETKSEEVKVEDPAPAPTTLDPARPKVSDIQKPKQTLGDELINYEESFKDLETKAADAVQSAPKVYQLLNIIGQLIATLVSHATDIRGFLAYRKAKSNPSPDSDTANSTNNVRS